MELRVNANAVITNSEGKILLIRLKKGPFTGGLCIPGGEIIPGELSHEAARREVFEETGIDIKTEFTPFGFCELRNKGVDKHKIVMLLSAQSDDMPTETEEGIGAWYDHEEVWQDIIPFAQRAIEIWKNNEMHFRLLEGETLSKKK